MNFQDPMITELIDATDIAILPSVNPDGFEVARKGSCSGNRQGRGRTNGNGVDLDHDFPSVEDKLEFDTNLDYDPFTNRSNNN